MTKNNIKNSIRNNSKIGSASRHRESPFFNSDLEKGGKHHEVPVHHKAQDYVAEYLEKAGFEPNKPLFQTFYKKAPTGRAMSRSTYLT